MQTYNMEDRNIIATHHARQCYIPDYCLRNCVFKKAKGALHREKCDFQICIVLTDLPSFLSKLMAFAWCIKAWCFRKSKLWPGTKLVCCFYFLFCLKLNQVTEIILLSILVNDLSSSLQEYHEKWNQMMQNSDTKLDKWVFSTRSELCFMGFF